KRIPKRDDADKQKDSRQEYGEESHARADKAVRLRGEHRAQIGGEGEERPRNRLRRAISGKELIRRHPARADDFCLEQRKHHVSAAKDERAVTVERIGDSQSLRRGNRDKDGQPEKEPEEYGQRQSARAMRDGKADVPGYGVGPGATQP